MASPSGSLLEAPPPLSFGKITDFLTPLSLQAAEAAGEQREEEKQGKTHSTVLSSWQQGSSANTSAADAPAGSTKPPALRIGSTEAGSPRPAPLEMQTSAQPTREAQGA